jgi:hypothetical protein
MKINRNDACPCGSEKKYKHCCGIKSSGNDGNKLIRSLIMCAILLVTGLTVYGVMEFYQEDRPVMEAYKCNNPNCGKIHYRPVAQDKNN